MVSALSALGRGDRDSVLVVLPIPQADRADIEKVYLSARNLKNVTVCTTENLSAYELLRHRLVFLDQNAIERIVEVLRP
jgi:ribosomal protein L4